MEFSQRTTVRKRLIQEYGIFFSKKDFYRAVCAYNDLGIRIGSFPDAIEELYYSKESMDDFVRHLRKSYKTKDEYKQIPA
jgi:hypothetical protein